MTKPSKELAERFSSSFVLADGELSFSICFIALCSCCFSLLSLFWEK
jgi:hypothetical protein